jgi:hypothetical protein
MNPLHHLCVMMQEGGNLQIQLHTFYWRDWRFLQNNKWSTITHIHMFNSKAEEEWRLSYSEVMGFWTFPSSRILNMTFRKLDLFPSPGEKVEVPTLLGPLERANINHWNHLPPPHLRMETDTFPKRCVFLYLEFRTMDKVQKPSNSESYITVRGIVQFVFLS